MRRLRRCNLKCRGWGILLYRPKILYGWTEGRPEVLLLRHRVNRGSQALEYYHNVFARIFAEFYPLATVTTSLEELCRVFSRPAKLRREVYHQIQSEARCAFALGIVIGLGLSS